MECKTFFSMFMWIYSYRLNGKFISSCRELDLASVDASLLIMNARNGQARIAKALIEAGANVNAKNNEGFTALKRAEKHGYHETARILIANRARQTP